MVLGVEFFGHAGGDFCEASGYEDSEFFLGLAVCLGGVVEVVSAC